MSTASTLKVHDVKGKTVVRRYGIIPYKQLTSVLRKDDEAFLEDDEGILKRGTVWKAARRLSVLVGHPVRAEKAVLRFEGKPDLQGYSFRLDEVESRQRRSRRR